MNNLKNWKGIIFQNAQAWDSENMTLNRSCRTECNWLCMLVTLYLILTSGLRSRCTTPWRWQNATTFNICIMTAFASSSVYFPPLHEKSITWLAVSSWPTNSIKFQFFSPSSRSKWTKYWYSYYFIPCKNSIQEFSSFT